MAIGLFRTVWLLALAGCFAPVCGQQAAVQKLLGAEGLKSASVSISVKSVADGKLVLDYRSGKSMQPASIVKLFSMALALKEKGENFRYRTPVWYTGTIRDGVLYGDIVVEASGDPSPDSRYFPEYRLTERLVREVKVAGIGKIRGDIRVETGGLSAELPGSWLWEDISNYYGSGWFPFNYRDNTYELLFTTGAAGAPARLTGVEPAVPDAEFRSSVVASAENRDNAWIYGGPYTCIFRVKGTIPANRAVFRVKGGMHRPDRCFLQEIRQLFSREGVDWVRDTLPKPGKTPWFEFRSPALEELVFHTNKKSINLFSEALGRLAAGADFQSGVRMFLAAIGSDSTGVVLKDACGLSPYNAVPAAAFTDLLVWVRSQSGEALVRSLPVAGVDSGLNAYCRNHPSLKNRLRAKTGSFSGVRTLSGYLSDRSGRLLAFTVLINHYDCPPARICDEVGAFLDAL
ncbi:MAG: D-alanyl-D-alanine carboxypeptidase/D-alanyl-D-alanine-endopeptidase [Culturomica sp.]|jgi:D-alanyl-D-alanine carboxypeptidase/D-alanyl-D-alanine-endopeptidase (penicillin-binding protein 4)|nr:D-alanyl-D-alanine carboxypeptidase/D-alanyl-D-alanine-endopeptidase [Culturomica sp.]